MPKPFITVSLLIILTSACSRPYTAASTPSAASATPTPLFNTINPIPSQTPTPLIVTATAALSCPAPSPHIQIGQQVTVIVENWDKLKLRSKPEVSPDTVVQDLEQYFQLEILEGPICVHSAETVDSYWFWKVKLLPSGVTGWVAEGDYSHYFIENAHG